MSTTISGNLKSLGTAAVTAGAAVKMSLKWQGNGVPRVNGTAIIAPSAVANGADRVSFPLTVNSSTGAITGTVYSTRDAAGTGDGEIEINGSLTSCWYELQVWVYGRLIWTMPVHAKNGVTLDLTSVTPITTNPTVTSPTGDTTYLRLDGGNAPMTGQLVSKDGTAASPGIAFASSLTTGFFRQAADVIGTAVAGVLKSLRNAAGWLLGSAQAIAWSSNADPSAAAGDTWATRGAAGQVNIGTTNGAADGTVNTGAYKVAGAALAFSNISGSVAASQLPNPSATTLGGVESLAAVSHKWINTISTSGVPAATQPAFSDISGTASASQLPSTPGKQIFTASGTFTIPTGVTAVKVTVVGAGGAGGGATTTSGSAAGGASGAAAIKWLTGLTPANTIAVTVGTGGTGSANAGGGNGGASSIASGTQTITTVTANGGHGGNAASGNNGQAGPSATNGDINIGGSASNGGITGSSNFGASGGASIFGGSGSGGLAGAGAAGNAPGAGGGGAGGSAAGTVAGGAGADGIVIFEWTN